MQHLAHLSLFQDISQWLPSLPGRARTSSKGYPNTLNEVKCRTSKYTSSFFPNCVKAWNDIEENIRNCDTIISKYKRKLLILVELNTFSNLGWVQVYEVP